jgi:hypothetical protein
MQGWTHWLMGAGFFGFGAFKLFTDGSPWLVGLCVVASGYLFYRALTDQTGAPVEDLDLAVSFVRDPKGTLVDQVVDLLGGGEDQPRDEKRREETRREDKPGLLKSFIAELDTRDLKSDDQFDPDAAIARYLANRPAEQPVPEPPALRPAVQGFGRKRA